MKKLGSIPELGVNIVEAKTRNGALGSWDGKTIRVKPGQHRVGKAIVIAHEAMHMTETCTHRRASEQFIEAAAYGVIAALSAAGMLKYSAAEVAKFTRNEVRFAKGRKR